MRQKGMNGNGNFSAKIHQITNLIIFFLSQKIITATHLQTAHIPSNSNHSHAHHTWLPTEAMVMEMATAMETETEQKKFGCDKAKVVRQVSFDDISKLSCALVSDFFCERFNFLTIRHGI